MARFGSFDGQNGYGQHFAINHSNRQFSEQVNVQEDNVVVRHLVPTNHIEASWHKLKETVKSNREFIDNQENIRFYVDGYIDAYVFYRRV